MSLSKATLFSLLLQVPLSWAACSDVHLFLARGNGEGYPGRVGDVYNTVCAGLPSCDYENILFDSSQSYCAQASDGVSSGLAQIAAYASACPNSKLVLGGYSLGAQIVGDILGGGGGTYYGCTENNSGALSASSSPGNKIVAALLFGDVRHDANEPYNVGDGSGSNGQYPREGASLAALNEYSAKLQSYCISTDPICALGDDGLSHTTYMTLYAAQAGAWVQQILAAGSSGATTSAPSSVVQTTLVTKSGSVTTSVPVTLTPGVPVTTPTAPVNSATFSPFKFSNTTYIASTSAPAATSPTAAPATTTSSVSTSPSAPANATFSSPQQPSYVQSTSGSYVNSAQLALTLVTLLVISALVL